MSDLPEVDLPAVFPALAPFRFQSEGKIYPSGWYYQEENIGMGGPFESQAQATRAFVARIIADEQARERIDEE